MTVDLRDPLEGPRDFQRGRHPGQLCTTKLSLSRESLLFYSQRSVSVGFILDARRAGT
jgi:hypothetical protein